MLRVLRRPDFRLLFIGTVATMVGESALLLVLAIWVKSLTGSSSLAGLTIFAVVAPALAAPLLGWFVDRFRRKPFLVAVVSATAAVLTPLLLVRDAGDVWLIYAVGVLYGISILLSSSALNALIKLLLPEELLAEANGALQTMRQGLRLVGPLGGAALFTAIGGPAVVAFAIGCLLLGATAIAMLKVQEAAPPRSDVHWVREAAAGMRHLFGPRSLRRATIGLAIAVTVIGFIETLIFAYVDLGLHRGPAFVTVLVCVQGIGGLSGGLVAARVVRRLGEIGTAAFGVALFGIGLGLLAYPQLWLGFTAAIVLGVSIPLTIVGFNTLLQRITPAELMGRVSAASEAVISTPQALSIAAGAALVLVLDYRLLFGLMAAVTFAVAGYLWTGRALSAPVTAPAAGSSPAVMTVDAPSDTAPAGPASPAAAPVGSPAGEMVLDFNDRRVGER